MRISTSLTAGAVGIALTLGLTACASPVEQLGESLVEQLIESQTGAEVKTDGEGGYSIETEDGSVQVGSSAEIPADFPAELPLPSGSLHSAWKTDASWQLVFQATAQGEYERLLAHYSSGGYQEILRTTPSNINDHQMAMYESGQWAVVLTWENVEGGTLTYTVSGR